GNTGYQTRTPGGRPARNGFGCVEGERLVRARGAAAGGPASQIPAPRLAQREHIKDLCQDVYVEVYEAAHAEIPQSAKAFVFAVARNILVDRIRREQIVSIEAV